MHAHNFRPNPLHDINTLFTTDQTPKSLTPPERLQQFDIFNLIRRAGGADQVDKLQLREVERAHKAVDSLYEHARAVMAVMGRHARRLGGTLEKAALLLLRLMDATVLPEDLASMQLDEHLLALRRKNLRQLQRLLRGAQVSTTHSRPRGVGPDRAAASVKGAPFTAVADRAANEDDSEVDRSRWREER